ncbi:hypothetical protein [Sphingomonas kyungheensis]|uniref:Uncharacterized protein n=1 Tax=Sphingomonas kyungheensis TaxID=1069987 RepID=A0ABU8H2N1_9SPHN
MPIVQRTRGPDDLYALATGALPEDRPQAAPSTMETLGAAWRQENIIGSVMARADSFDGTNNNVDPGYNPWKDIQGTPYEQHWDRFTSANNAGYTEALKRQIDRESEDRKTLASAGWAGTAAMIATSVVDPTILIPVGGEIAKVGSAYRIGRSALALAAAGGVSTAIQEAGLQATQDLRTPEESYTAIGSGIVLGGLLGAGAATLMSKAERQTAAEALHGIVTAQPGSAGAAAVERATVGDLTVAGNITERVASATRALSPNLRANFRESAAAREVSQQLAENTLYQTMHGEGRSLGAAAETLARSTYLSRMADAVKAHNAIFADMKKAGTNMSRPEFEEAVGNAMRNGDTDANPFVSRAASAWRERVFDPFKNEAIDLGLLPDDVGVDTAASYLSRVWNRGALTAREPEFKEIVTGFYRDRIGQDYAESVEALKSRNAALDQELADLRLSPKDRTAALADIEAKATRLDEANPDQIDRVSRINDLRRQARDAEKAGNGAAARDARAEAARAAAEGGEGLRSYLKERGALRGRRSRVDMNYAGIADRADRLLNTLSDMQEGNAKSLQRLVQRGQVFERSAQRLDPGKLADKLSDLRSAFADVVQRSERAQDRIARVAERLGDDAPAGMAERLQREAAAEAARHERLNSLSRRMEAAEALDPDAALAELRQAMEGAAREVSDMTLARGERAQRLKDRLARLDPAKVDARVQAIADVRAKLERDFYDRWEIAHGGVGVDAAGGAKADFTDAARDIADSVFDKLTGRAMGGGDALPDYLTPITRGPMKDRTFNIPDALVTQFLDSNVMSVAERYGRTMASETELTRRFGRPDMRDQITAIRRDYADLRANAGADEARLKALSNDEHGAIEDLTAMRDLIRGTYKSAENGGDFGRIVRGLTAFNYIRSMGRVVLSNLSDLYRGATAQGVGRFMSQGVPALIGNLDAVKLSIHEAQLAGQVTERVLQNRLATLGEIGDPYRSGTAIERLLQNGTRIGSTWNGMSLFTDMSKSIASIMSQNRILDAVAGRAEDGRFLAYLGIDGDMARRVGREFAEHGQVIEGVRVANTERWNDVHAVRAYRAAVSKEVDSVVVTRSVGDVPLFAHTPLGKAMLQFKTYNLASHQRVLLRGMQEGKTQFTSMMVGMTSVGLLSAWLRAYAVGGERYERFMTAAENPGYVLGEALDASGFFALPIEAAATADTMTGFNPVKDPLMAAFPNAPQGGQGVRRIGVDPVGKLLGPSAGLIADTSKAAGAPIGAATGDPVTDSQVEAMKRLVPFQSYLGMRQALDLLTTDE